MAASQTVIHRDSDNRIFIRLIPEGGEAVVSVENAHFGMDIYLDPDDLIKIGLEFMHAAFQLRDRKESPQ